MRLSNNLFSSSCWKGRYRGDGISIKAKASPHVSGWRVWNNPLRTAGSLPVRRSGTDVRQRRLPVLHQRQVPNGNKPHRPIPIDNRKPTYRLFAHQTHCVVHVVRRRYRNQLCTKTRSVSQLGESREGKALLGEGTGGVPQLIYSPSSSRKKGMMVSRVRTRLAFRARPP